MSGRQGKREQQLSKDTAVAVAIGKGLQSPLKFENFLHFFSHFTELPNYFNTMYRRYKSR